MLKIVTQNTIRPRAIRDKFNAVSKRSIFDSPPTFQLRKLFREFRPMFSTKSFELDFQTKGITVGRRILPEIASVESVNLSSKFLKRFLHLFRPLRKGSLPLAMPPTSTRLLC